MNKATELFIQRLDCPWWTLKRKIEMGDAGQQEVVDLLTHQISPPPELLPWIASIITKEQKFKPGNKRPPFHIRREAALWAIWLTRELEKIPNLLKQENPRDLALLTVAERYHCDSRTIERWIAEQKRIDRDLADASGNPLSVDEMTRNAYEMAVWRDQWDEVLKRHEAATSQEEIDSVNADGEVLVRQKIEMLNQRIESHKAAVAKLPAKRRNLLSYQDELTSLEAARDEWAQFLI